MPIPGPPVHPDVRRAAAIVQENQERQRQQVVAQLQYQLQSEAAAAAQQQQLLAAQQQQRGHNKFCLFSDFKHFRLSYVYHDRKEQKTGEAGFLADRHAAASSLISPGGDAGLLKSLPSVAELVALFDDQKLKELAFCDKKKRLAEIQGYLLGVLHPDRVTAELTSSVAAHMENANKLQRDRSNRQALVRKRVTHKEAWQVALKRAAVV